MSRATDLAEKLQGTCDSIGDEQDEWTTAELLEFDDLVFCCETCGWWFEVGEMAEVEDATLCGNCCEPSADC